MAATLRTRLCAAIAAIEPIGRGEGVFHPAEPAFFVDGRLVAEFAGPNAVGLRLTWPVIREHKAELAADHRVDPIKTRSDWIAVTFRRAADIAFITDLVARAVPAYLPRDGRTVRPPPEGADLARLRRFH